MNIKSKISEEIAKVFKAQSIPVPWGFLDNEFINKASCMHKKLLADAYYRAYRDMRSESVKTVLKFNIYERGRFYKKKHENRTLKRIFEEIEALGFITILDHDESEALINLEKCLNR